MSTASTDHRERRKSMKPLLDDNTGYQTADYIRSVIPSHKVWCEPYFFEGKVFFTKRPSPKEVINDRDDRIVNFYLTVRTRAEQMAFLSQTVLYSDFMDDLVARIDADSTADALHRAWAFYIRYRKSIVVPSKWKPDDVLTLNGDTLYAKAWMAVAERLKDTFISNRHPMEVVSGVDGVDTLFLLSPRTRKELVECEQILDGLKGKAILYYSDNKVLDKMAGRKNLFSDENGKKYGVYTTFQRERNLFEL